MYTIINQSINHFQSIHKIPTTVLAFQVWYHLPVISWNPQKFLEIHEIPRWNSNFINLLELSVISWISYPWIYCTIIIYIDTWCFYAQSTAKVISGWNKLYRYIIPLDDFGVGHGPAVARVWWENIHTSRPKVLSPWSCLLNGTATLKNLERPKCVVNVMTIRKGQMKELPGIHSTMECPGTRYPK